MQAEGPVPLLPLSPTRLKQAILKPSGLTLSQVTALE